MAQAQKKEDEKDGKVEEFEVEIEGEAAPKKAPVKEEKVDEPDADDDEERVARTHEDEGSTEEERQKIREERRKERAERKRRQKEREEQKDRELASLREETRRMSQMLGSMQTRNASTDFARIEEGIRQAQSEVEQAEDIIKKGVAEQNGEAVAAAQRAMLEAARRADQLANYRDTMIRAARQQQQQAQQPPTPDPEVIRNARAWMAKNSWYDPSGKDDDSAVAMSIDNKMAEQGWNPRDPKYWEEFDRRVAKYLPHRVKGGRVDDDDEDSGSPTSGSGRESASQGGKAKYRLSADRVAAMKEAGQWDQFQEDKVFRARMIKRFQDADSKIGGKS